MEERRHTVRREADRELLEMYRRLKSEVEAGGASGARKLRRRAIRHHCKVQVTLASGYQNERADVWRPSGTPVKGRILDLSNEGCSVFTRDPIDIGTRVGLKIELEGEGGINVQAVVRWSKSIPEKGGVASGTQFAKLSPEESRRIEAFLKRMDETAGL